MVSLDFPQITPDVNHLPFTHYFSGENQHQDK